MGRRGRVRWSGVGRGGIASSLAEKEVCDLMVVLLGGEGTRRRIQGLGLAG